MTRPTMTKEQYRAGAKRLTVEDLDHYGRRIVPSSVALAILSKKAGRELERSTLIQKCRAGKLLPMGIYKNTLYFWRNEVEAAPLYHRKSPEERAQRKTG